MDSEHRHDLEENVLANWLARAIEDVKPYAPSIGAGLLVALAASIGWTTYRSSSAAGRADSWRMFTLAVEGSQPSLEALRMTAEENPGTDVEDWALVTWADGRLWNATNEFLRNRDTADEALQEAQTAYESLLAVRDPSVADRAAFGLARVHEMRGDLDEAIRQYGRVAGPFAEIAAERAEQLDSPRVKQDYAWITSAETEAVAPGAEADGATDEQAADEAADPVETLDDLLQSLRDTDAADGEAAPDESADAAPEE